MLKRIALIFAALTLLAIMIGCSKAPEAEMQNANAAMEAAKMAEAETYAGELFNAAQDTLNSAMAAKQEQDSKFALFRSYGKAKEGFVAAEQMFNNAATEAAAEKERVRVQVEQMMVEVKAVVDSAVMALQKAPRGKGSKADIELIKTDLAAVQAQLVEAEADFATGKFMAVKSKLEAVAQKARAIIDEIAVASGKKVGM
ncbi:MAG: hypothetical protein A2W25_03355 [candidate division Zixibacteria bacterium RBG_16_53_22]|nr:MAG: hypothetical protein A2W25_03355 [candidate division Zixibacteria bacterium RBG_16_53_22]